MCDKVYNSPSHLKGRLFFSIKKNRAPTSLEHYKDLKVLKEEGSVKWEYGFLYLEEKYPFMIGLIEIE